MTKTLVVVMGVKTNSWAHAWTDNPDRPEQAPPHAPSANDEAPPHEETPPPPPATVEQNQVAVDAEMHRLKNEIETKKKYLRKLKNRLIDKKKKTNATGIQKLQGKIQEAQAGFVELFIDIHHKGGMNFKLRVVKNRKGTVKAVIRGLESSSSDDDDNEDDRNQRLVELKKALNWLIEEEGILKAQGDKSIVGRAYRFALKLVYRWK